MGWQNRCKYCFQTGQLPVKASKPSTFHIHMLKLVLRESFNVTHILQRVIFSRRGLRFKLQTMLGYKVPVPNEH